jgi:hypothetical protein
LLNLDTLVTDGDGRYMPDYQSYIVRPGYIFDNTPIQAIAKVAPRAQQEHLIGEFENNWRGSNGALNVFSRAVRNTGSGDCLVQSKRIVDLSASTLWDDFACATLSAERHFVNNMRIDGGVRRKSRG